MGWRMWRYAHQQGLPPYSLTKPKHCIVGAGSATVGIPGPLYVICFFSTRSLKHAKVTSGSAMYWSLTRFIWYLARYVLDLVHSMCLSVRNSETPFGGIQVILWETFISCHLYLMFHMVTMVNIELRQIYSMAFIILIYLMSIAKVIMRSYVSSETSVWAISHQTQS